MTATYDATASRSAPHALRTRDIIIAAIIGVAFGVVFGVGRGGWNGPLAVLDARHPGPRPRLCGLAYARGPRAPIHPASWSGDLRLMVAAGLSASGTRGPEAPGRIGTGRRSGGRIRISRLPVVVVSLSWRSWPSPVPRPRDPRRVLYFAAIDPAVQVVRFVFMAISAVSSSWPVDRSADRALEARRRARGFPHHRPPTVSRGSLRRATSPPAIGAPLGWPWTAFRSSCPLATPCWSSGRPGPARARSRWPSGARPARHPGGNGRSPRALSSDNSAASPACCGRGAGRHGWQDRDSQLVMDRVEDDVAFGLENRAWPRSRCVRGSRRRSTRLGSTGWHGSVRGACPADSSNAWPWPVQWRRAPASWCWTSRPPISTVAQRDYGAPRAPSCRTTMTIVRTEHLVEAAWAMADRILALDGEAGHRLRTRRGGRAPLGGPAAPRRTWLPAAI